MVASLRLDRLYRTFGKVLAVDGLSLDVTSGSFVTLLGPSGCGKSTTLAMIAGLERPDQGTIHLGEEDITNLPPNMRRMAMVFQDYALYPHMSVFDNMGFSLKLMHRPRLEITARVNAIAELLDLGHLVDRKPIQLSGGQQQRVALGRALVKRPDVFLLDEPFSNLDAGLRARMRTEVKHLHAQLGTTSVFVTHDQEEAMALSDLVAVMRDGRVVQYGSPHEIYQRPQDVYVASFIGRPRISLIEGSLEAHEDRIDFVTDDLRINLGPQPRVESARRAGHSVVLGVRAEDARVGVPTLEADATPLTASIQLVEPVGADTFLELQVGGATLVARAAPDPRYAVGDILSISVASTRLHLFDRETGSRIN